VARQAHLDAVERINTRHAELAAKMLDVAEAEIPLAGQALSKSPHALAEWVKTAVKTERDAVGILPPENRALMPGEQGSSSVQREMSAGLSLLSAEDILLAHDLTLRMVQAASVKRAQERAQAPRSAFPTFSFNDDDVVDAEVVSPDGGDMPSSPA
jgi:hypothetical protein